MTKILALCKPGLVLLLAAALGAAACPWACGQEVAKKPQPRRLRVVVVGAHCDDPESGAGGLIVSLSRAGHEVIVAYMACFRDGRKCFGRPEAEVRRHEAEAACKIMGATAKFFPYDAAKFVADEATLSTVAAWLDEVKPDIVVAHWPLDMHPNHHVASALVWQCYRKQGVSVNPLCQSTSHGVDSTSRRLARERGTPQARTNNNGREPCRVIAGWKRPRGSASRWPVIAFWVLPWY